LDDPYAVFREDAGGIGDESVRTLQVVEHGDGSDDPELLAGNRSRAEKIVDDAIGAVGGSFSRQVFGRFEAHAFYPRGFVGAEQRSVIAADIQNVVAAAKRDEFRRFARDVGKRLAHRAIHAGLVPVAAIEPVARRGVAKLEKRAIGAKDDLE